ncbi:MAG: LysR family transcriptional regulator [Alphaproteobacteria bacterium]|nr:LysR family transcriptional regulator [Alphaproteobacteria bacterium]
MSYTLRQLRYFVAAAEAGGATAAAAAVRIAQPSISAAIAQLEAELGVQLFVRRHAQGLALTPAGRRLLASAKALLAHADELRQTAQGLGEGLAGTLELGCFVTFAPFVLPGLLHDFAVAHPEIHVALREADLGTAIDDLRQGRSELALTYELDLGSGITFESLTEVPVHAILPANHRLARRRTVPLAALAPEPLVLLSLPRSREYFLSLFLTLGLTPTIGHETPSFELLRGLVANGFGYALMHSRPPLDVALDGKRLAHRPLADPLRAERMGLARLARSRPTRMATAFAAFCRAHYAASS